MKIQVISYNQNLIFDSKHECTYSSLNKPFSFDAFDLNIISLQTPQLWVNSGSSINFINDINDFLSLQNMIKSVKKSKVIICFPQNYSYKYYYISKSYKYERQLKDMIQSLKEIIDSLIPQGIDYEMSYENSTTICQGLNLNAAFCFEGYASKNRSLTKCSGSEHVTTFIAKENLIFTSLDFPINAEIDGFLKFIGLVEKKSEIPSWLSDFECFDDIECKNAISENQARITLLNDQISKNQEKLEENERYKRVLIESGDPLVEIVFEILEKMLDYDLSTFVDEKKQDFLIRKEKTTFIGEIKGISSNVTYENVSQLERHHGSYLDELEKEGKSENVKMLLIINPFRTKPLNEREPVHINQIKLAQKYGSLIITTEVLLALFEKFINGNLNQERIIGLFASKVGILEKTDF